MPIFLLDHRLVFPDPARADESGILAVGGDLSPERLMLAYGRGIFPWFGEGQPILWHAPAWRMAMRPEDLHVGRSLRKALRRKNYEIRYDTAFADVLAGCALTDRPGQSGTWLTPDMRRAYLELHRRGHAHSAETWMGGRLVGGLYGVVLGGAFFGESMFSRVADASKLAFATLVPALAELGYLVIDCQVYTDHLSSLGAREWPRAYFQQVLAEVVGLRPRAVWPGQAEARELSSGGRD